MVVVGLSVLVVFALVLGLLRHLAWLSPPWGQPPAKQAKRASNTTGASSSARAEYGYALRNRNMNLLADIFKSRARSADRTRPEVRDQQQPDAHDAPPQHDASSSGSTTPTSSRPSTPSQSSGPQPPSLSPTPSTPPSTIASDPDIFPPAARAMEAPSIAMPPPPVPAKSPKRTSPISTEPRTSLRAPLNNQSTLRVPNGLSVPARGVPLSANRSASLLTPNSARTPANGSTMLNPATGNPISNGRKKVHLEPGHSPLDWANLTRSGKNLSGVPFPQRVTPSQLKEHNGRKGKPRWTSFRRKVYNLDPYLPFHPGGKSELLKAVGKSADELFDDVHPWVNWESIMGPCLVGFMIDETPGSNPLDEQD